MKMVVPGSTSVIQPDHSLGTELSRSSAENSVMGPDTESMADQVGPELEEVRKLQELVRRLELQNQQLRTRSLRSVPEAKMLSQADAGVDNCNSRLNGMEMNNSINVLMDKQELQIVADLHSALSKIRSDAEESGKFFKKNAEESTIHHGCENISDQQPSGTKFMSSTQTQNSDANTNDVPRWDCNPMVLLEDFATSVEPVLQMKEANTNAEDPLDETALDEVELLELENGSDEEDSWLYVSPRKPPTDKKESPLKWCRQVLDHPSPETEAACRTLLTRLDQASRWKSLYCSPLASPSVHNLNADTGSCSNALNSPGHYKSTNKPLLTCGSSGYLNMHSALSSQSSVDSELSTSDDSISMGYKLQDLTDVQVMARLQEESLRQDCASSSASVSRRSSSASLHSLRRGTYSDQDFDTYSLEDEDDDCSFSYHSSHRYSPSPLSSPRCQSPSTNADYGRATNTRIRPPRRTVQSPMQDRLKYSSNEEELRHSMPNLARTGLRSLESVRNSRSLDSDLQIPSNRLSRIHQESISLTPNKLRYSSGAGQSPLTVRQPVKAGPCANALLTPRQPVRSAGYGSPAGRVRKLQSSTLNPSASSGGSSVYRSNSVATGAKSTLPKNKASVAGASTLKSKLSQPAKRYPKANIPVDDSWKDGCY
ncbi:SLAIN motif-containing protein-like isoform X1 [Thamnophis elegans]|uniref:SLAIN motif-containing protein-like isoform X1 n=1 Tax=Thamnophis elegans TaxID=35005 RepID=UPI00137773ED|nr:SLAIN motif-containing protein-like isoform X1 [Thamnophis elegans]XP_032083576.1 SLAIN motif-containing protein-like isoform X1 [Thamnophis elegans]XP_032083577.1 SLAIN motif-containing protein-like isoform X1 [Thamnophis elegans]